MGISCQCIGDCFVSKQIFLSEENKTCSKISIIFFGSLAAISISAACFEHFVIKASSHVHTDVEIGFIVLGLSSLLCFMTSAIVHCKPSTKYLENHRIRAETKHLTSIQV